MGWIGLMPDMETARNGRDDEIGSYGATLKTVVRKDLWVLVPRPPLWTPLGPGDVSSGSILWMKAHAAAGR